MPPMIHTLRVARYQTTNGIGIAILALLTILPDNQIFDWTAYIGASPYTEHPESAITATRRWGNKLSIQDAAHYFPHLDIERYRT